MAKLSPFANYHVFKKADRSYAPCNDMFYGPHIAATESEGIDAAWSAMTAVFDSSSNLLVPPIGWTFAVQNSITNEITEYQLTGGTTKDCIVLKGSANANFSKPQEGIIYDMFTPDGSKTATIYDSGNGGTATKHAIVIWDKDENTLYIKLTLALAIGSSVCTITTSDGTSTTLKVLSNGKASTSTNDITSITFTTIPTSISVKPGLAIENSWHWYVDNTARNITPAITLNLD